MLRAAASSRPTCCVPRLGSLSPYDFSNPRAALIKAVLALTERIREYDQRIERIAKEVYPEVALLAFEASGLKVSV